MPQLTEVKLRAIKRSGKIERFHDKGGLYLELSAAGGKHWRWKYAFEGKEKRLSFGAWPDVSLKDAREKRDACRKALNEGVDPGQEKRRTRIGELRDGAETFKAVAEEWVKNQRNVWVESHAETVESRLARNVYPYIGDTPIADITPQDVLALLRKIEERGAYEVAKRVLGICSLVFRYGVAIGVVTSDPCRDLRGALVPRQKGQFAALTKPKDVGILLLAIDEYKGSGVVRAALKFSALTFCRPGEIRKAEWAEFDLEIKEWTIPAEKMKVRVEHRVPLSRQALDVIDGLRPLTGHGRYLFLQIGLLKHFRGSLIRLLLVDGGDLLVHTGEAFLVRVFVSRNQLHCRCPLVFSVTVHKNRDLSRLGGLELARDGIGQAGIVPVLAGLELQLDGQFSGTIGLGVGVLDVIQDVLQFDLERFEDRSVLESFQLQRLTHALLLLRFRPGFLPRPGQATLFWACCCLASLTMAMTSSTA